MKALQLLSDVILSPDLNDTVSATRHDGSTPPARRRSITERMTDSDLV